MSEHELKVHEILNDFLGGYIPVQELTHAANEICKTINEEDKTVSGDAILDMHGYLHRFDKEFIAAQTVNTKPITNNQATLGIHMVRKYLRNNSFVETLKEE